MDKIAETIKAIEKIDYSLAQETQKRLDNLTKPPGSLGRLEELAKQIVQITKNKNPQLNNKVIFTLVGDHGVVEEGISAYPKEVTAQMVYNFLKGGAGINVLARHINARVIVVDMAVAEKIPNSKSKIQNFKDKKISYGTKNMTEGPAMTKEEAVRSIEAGIGVLEEEFFAKGVIASGGKRGIDILGTGDMGIGNTTVSSAITAVITGSKVEDVTGRGTGIDEIGLARKIEVIKKALAINKPDPQDPLDILSKIGGFEIGGLVGIILSAASKRIPIILDGFISGAAALIAYKLEPGIKDYTIASHSSVEKGHKIILEFLGLKPILDLNLRLGEGTGAALAMGIVEAAIKILNEMATFEDAGVSKSKVN